MSLSNISRLNIAVLTSLHGSLNPTFWLARDSKAELTDVFKTHTMIRLLNVTPSSTWG